MQHPYSHVDAAGPLRPKERLLTLDVLRSLVHWRQQPLRIAETFAPDAA